MRFHFPAILFLLYLVCLSCKDRHKPVAPPSPAPPAAVNLDLDDIRQNGELIMLTIYGPTTYYDYHGHGMGVNYLLCEELAKHLGVRLRVDVCRDTAESLQRLRDGEGDIVAIPLSKHQQSGDNAVANGWLVSSHSPHLTQAIRAWFKPAMLDKTREQEHFLLSAASVTRHVYPWLLSAAKGQISSYDHLFRKYATVAQLPWTLLASQCYQESCFDPQARSWAGACGLMQIMPSTADHLSLPREQLFQPEPNIAAAARYMRELQATFDDIENPSERTRFALAAYNGGTNHVRDAMSLASKHGGSPMRWDDVKRYILLLQDPQYYNDPVVKSGYMRGSETAQYVDMIMQRHSQYRRALATGQKVSSAVAPSERTLRAVTPIEAIPHRAAKKNKWRKE